MLDSYPTINDLRSGQRLRRTVVLIMAIVAVLLVVGSMTAMAILLPRADPTSVAMGAFIIVICIAVPVVICFRPRIGLYILFVSALLFPSTSVQGLPTMPTLFVPLWWNVSTIGSRYLGTYALNGVSVSPAELVMMLTFTVWLVRAIALRQLTWKVGTFFWAIAAYMTMVACGFINGMSHGGQLTMALYEIRGQFYFLLTYLMAVNIIDDRRQITTLLWLIVICNAIQSLGGALTFIVQHDHIAEDGFMPHDESLLLNLIFFVAILTAMLPHSKRLKWTAFAVAPIALVAILGNQRRAGIAAFIIAFIPLLPILWTLLKEQRKQITYVALVFGLVSAVYLPVAWSANGAWALPARAIRSQFDPSARDASSNTYRSSEDFDLTVTRDVSPIIGYGYGKPFLQPVPLPAVTTDFVYFMAHDSILWVWMRIGHIGFFLFWLMIATFLIRGIEMLKASITPEGRSLGMLAIMMVLMMLTFGRYDLALVDGKILTITAILLGVLAILPSLEGHPRGGAPHDEQENADGLDEAEDLHYDQIGQVRLGGIPF